MISAIKHRSVILCFFLVALTCVTGWTSCSDESFSSSPDCKLSFSTDTLSFDTVFATLGSATSKVMIYNRNSSALRISSIELGGKKSSAFRINVDGTVSENNQFTNIEIPAKDSLYIFVAVTIDPLNSNSPEFIEDSITFITNGTIQKVKLQAYGQNMEILRDKHILNDTILTADKPYLIYGDLTVDTAKTLTLQPGCKLYFHNNANLKVYGNLKAVGTPEKQILLRGDRLDKIRFTTPVPYNYVSGQWGGVYLLWGNGNHRLEFVRINSGYNGLVVANTNTDVRPKLVVNSCRIHNFLQNALWIENADVEVTNSEISNAGGYCVYLSGGSHTFIHCTIANYFNNSNVQPISRSTQPAVKIMNLERVTPMQSIFENCVIAGTNTDEFELETRFGNQYNGIFKNCYIKRSEKITLPQFAYNYWSERKDTVFKSVTYNEEEKKYFDFNLDSISPARRLADKGISADYPIDLNGNNRNWDDAPDAGAYEWKEK